MVQLNDEGEDDMEELSFSSLAKKEREIELPPAPVPVVEAPKAATPDVKQEKKEEKEATPVPATTPVAAPPAATTPAPTAAPAAATPSAETPPV